MVNWPSRLSRMRELFKCASSKLGQLPPPSSAHAGLYQRPHWGGSRHRTLACPQGSGPRPLLLSLSFLLGEPTLIYPGLKARISASAPPVYMAPHPSPSVLHPCRRRPITKTLAGPRQEYCTGLRFGVMWPSLACPDRTAQCSSLPWAPCT